MAKIMRKTNFKIQMLAGKKLKICIGAGSEISTILSRYSKIVYSNKTVSILKHEVKSTLCQLSTIFSIHKYLSYVVAKKIVKTYLGTCKLSTLVYRGSSSSASSSSADFSAVRI